MYSGNKTIDYPTQWALNPSAYQDMTNDQVDWAALAQQWIQMKESCPTVVIPPAPPPPIISAPVLEEEGEAPMDVEGNEVDAAPSAPTISSQQWKNPNNSNWSNSWDQWGEGNQENWNWQSNSSKVSQPPSGPPPYSTGYTSTDANFSGYNNNGPQNYRTGYWSTDAENKPNNIPNQMNEIGNRILRRIPRQQNAADSASSSQINNSVDTTQTIDAAKRRQLPAWIREGLEKMEREKQKQMDRERELKEREELMKQKELDAVQQPNQDDGVPQIPAKSKFESDSNDSESETEVKKPPKVLPREQIAPIPLLPKTQEEIMQEMMLCVRRTLTEILLDVTNEQILEVCQEELNWKRSQPQASRGTSVASKSQALSSIGGQLGLGIYGDSSGESDSDTETGEEEGRRSTTPVSKHRKRAELTDAQLQESIRRKMADFEKTAREIENQIASDDAAHKKNDGGDVANRTSTTEDRSLRDGLGNSDSDGEESTTHNRNEVNSSRQRKFSSDKTPLADNAKKSFSDKSEKYSHYSKSNADTKTRHGESSNSKRETTNKHDSSKRRRNGSKKGDPRPSNSKRRSRSLSTGSNSERSENSEKDSYSRSPSSSSNTESSYSGSSHSSRSHRKHSRKSKKISEDRLTVKKRDKGRSKRSRKNDPDESDSERKNTRDSVSSNRRSHTPDRRYKRSRSRSEDRHGYYYDKKHYNSNRYRSREQDRSRDRKSDYRDKKERSRDRGSERYNRDRSRDRRDTSKENRGSSKDKYDRNKRGDRRDYKDNSRRSRY